MTIYEIGILTHYYACADDPDSLRAPIGPETAAQFVRDGLLEPNGIGPKYRITERGVAYAEALQAVPLPTQRWVVEWPKEPA